MKTHDLKIWPLEFRAVREGIKTFEFRKNDRDFNRGDVLKLNQFNPDTGSYSGEWIAREVNYVTYGPAFGIPEGFCVMAIV